MYDNTKIGEDSSILAHKGKFVMKANSRAGMRLTVICQNHSTYNKVGGYPDDEEWWKEQPAHFIKFKFSIEEQIEHEKIRYPESERLDESLLMDNYKKFRK